MPRYGKLRVKQIYDHLKKRQTCSFADKRFLGADATKFGRRSLYRISATGGFDGIFSERQN